MCRANEDIRKEAKESGIHLYQIGEKLGLNDGNFSRFLRHEIPENKKIKIRSIIKELKGEQ